MKIKSSDNNFSGRYHFPYSSIIGHNRNTTSPRSALYGRCIFAGKGLFPTRFFSQTAHGLTYDLTGCRRLVKNVDIYRSIQKTNLRSRGCTFVSNQLGENGENGTSKSAFANEQMFKLQDQQRESVGKFVLALLLLVVVMSITTHSSLILTLPFFQSNPEELAGYIFTHKNGLQWGWVGYLLVTIIPGMLSYLPPELIHLVKIYLSVKNHNNNENSSDAFPIIDWKDLWSDEQGSLNKMKLTLKFCDCEYSLNPEKKVKPLFSSEKELHEGMRFLALRYSFHLALYTLTSRQFYWCVVINFVSLSSYLAHISYLLQQLTTWNPAFIQFISGIIISVIPIPISLLSQLLIAICFVIIFVIGISFNIFFYMHIFSRITDFFELYVHIPFVNLLQTLGNRDTIIYRMAYNNMPNEFVDRDRKYPNDPEFVKATPNQQVEIVLNDMVCCFVYQKA